MSSTIKEKNNNDNINDIKNKEKDNSQCSCNLYEHDDTLDTSDYICKKCHIYNDIKNAKQNSDTIDFNINQNSDTIDSNINQNSDTIDSNINQNPMCILTLKPPYECILEKHGTKCKYLFVCIIFVLTIICVIITINCNNN